MSKYRVVSGPYFPLFRLNTRIYFVNLRIQSEYKKMRTKKNSVFGQFSRIDCYRKQAWLSVFLLYNFIEKPGMVRVLLETV